MTVYLKPIEFKFKIDGLTYWLIDDLLKQKNVEELKINLDTNRFIGELINKALKEFIINHQYLLTEQLKRDISLIDDKLDGKEIRFEDIFKTKKSHDVVNEKECDSEC